MPGLSAAVRIIPKSPFPHTVSNRIMRVFGQFLWGVLYVSIYLLKYAYWIFVEVSYLKHTHKCFNI